MAQIKITDSAGKSAGTIEVSDGIFAIEPNGACIHQVVRSQMAARRQGTHDTKTRGQVSGGGRKPFRQKGTGRARQGTTRAAQFRHGGVVFGPHPRSYAFRVNNKVVKLAMASVLSGKLAAGTDHISANTSRPELYYAGSVCIDARGRVIGDEFDGYEVCASHPGSLLLVRNWALGCTMLMNGALVKLLRRRPVFDFARSYDTWIHAVALYCDGYVFCDLPHCYVDRRLAPGQSVLPACDDLDPELADQATTMARVLLREYERAMNPDAAKLVEAVAVRHVSAKARRFLAGRTDIMLPTNPRTSKLRWNILRSKF